MKYNYQNISISKDFYKTAEGFSSVWSDWTHPSSIAVLSLQDMMPSSVSSSVLISRYPVTTVTDFRNSLRHRTVLLFSQSMFPEQ